jgi:hypothetical protein
VLADEIIKAQQSVRTDAYQMSVGEIVSMYENLEIIVDPEFQRLFRWNVGQKSKLIESLLLGIPLPSIFVFETEDGSWELIDGLQRVSTILEFMGKLRNPDGGMTPPSIMEATKYLGSLHNAVWEKSDLIPALPLEEQSEIDKIHQLSIRRARIGVEILKRPSGNQMKFELFQRLNAGGTQANAQELRNCIMLMVNPNYFRSIKSAAEGEEFQLVCAITEDQIDRQRHMELAVRFLVLCTVPYDGKLDVEEYIDNGVITLAHESNGASAAALVNRTFTLLKAVAGKDALRRFNGNHHIGKSGLVGLETIAVGVAKNIEAILAHKNPHDFINSKIQQLWIQPEVDTFLAPGLRGTIRLQRTVPFGNSWFRP